MAVEVLISHRHNEQPHKAVRIGDVVMCDEDYPRHAGRRRYFWLLSYGAQLVYEPFGWHDSWYVDLVAYELGRQGQTETVMVRDLTVDLVVEGMGPTYRILDLDEAATLAEAGNVSDVTEALRRAQVFLDAFLHRGAPFPPPSIRPWFNREHDYPRLSVTS